MSEHISKYIEEHQGKISHITRSIIGTWTIALKRDGNCRNRSISSYSQLTDEEVDTLRGQGYRVFDFKSQDNFWEIYREMQSVLEIECY